MHHNPQTRMHLNKQKHEYNCAWTTQKWKDLKQPCCYTVKRFTQLRPPTTLEGKNWISITKNQIFDISNYNHQNKHSIRPKTTYFQLLPSEQAFDSTKNHIFPTITIRKSIPLDQKFHRNTIRLGLSDLHNQTQL